MTGESARGGGWQAALFTGLVAALVMSPGLARGYIITHSSMFNVAWAEGFARLLAAGAIYPRWLPEMNAGLGSPVFYFYGPLPFYLTAPFVWLTGDAGLAVVIGSTVMLALSGLAGYALFREFAAWRDSLVIAIAYMVMPYHLFCDVWVRGAYGEQASFVLLPLALLFLHRLESDRRHIATLALAVAGLAFSHLPSTAMAAVLLAGLTLASAVRRHDPGFLLAATGAGMLGLSLAAIYVLPALAGRSFIKPEFWMAFAPAEHTLGIPGQPLDYFLLASFLVPMVILALLAIAARRGPGLKTLQPWLSSGVIIALLVTPLAIPLWMLAGPFKVVQFPWRLLGPFDLLVCLVLARVSAIDRVGFGRALRLLAVAIFGFAVLTTALRQSPGPERGSALRQSESFEKKRLAQRADGLEYLPTCAAVQADQLAGPLSTGLFLEHLGGIPTPPGDARLFYYPFLELRSGEERLTTSCDPGTGLTVVGGGARPLMTVERRALPIERWALYLSAAAALVVVLLLLAGGLRGRRGNARSA